MHRPPPNPPHPNHPRPQAPAHLLPPRGRCPLPQHRPPPPLPPRIKPKQHRLPGDPPGPPARPHYHGRRRIQLVLSTTLNDPGWPTDKQSSSLRAERRNVRLRAERHSSHSTDARHTLLRSNVLLTSE